MWSSTLPTGTVRDERRANRTFPRSTQAPGDCQPPRQTKSTASPTGRSPAASNTEVQRLRDENRQARAEIQRLEARVESLSSQLNRQQAGKQAMVDRYEQVISELETAVATAPDEQPTNPASAGASTTGPTTEKIVDRLRNWL